jgi:hypothetical protein
MAVTYNIDVNFFPEIDNTSAGAIDKDRDDVACDEFIAPQYYEIENGAADLAISLGPLTAATIVVMYCDQAITFKANTYGPFTMVANDPVILPNVTALTVSNSTGQTGKLVVGAAGT